MLLEYNIKKIAMPFILSQVKDVNKMERNSNTSKLTMVIMLL